MRKGLWGLALGAVWALVVTAPAFADEFDVGILVGERVEAVDFMDGFQMAVDQSPDVSHTPGTEGGDHLGSMDVTFVVVGTAADVSGFPIIVVDAPADELATTANGSSSTTGLVIAFADIDPPDIPGLFRMERSTGAAMASSLSPSFETDFVARYGRIPSPDAARGYTAGKLVDVAVEATGRDPSDLATMVTELDSISATGEPAPATATAAVPPLPDNGDRGLSFPPGAIAVVAVALLLVASISIRNATRSNRDDAD